MRERVMSDASYFLNREQQERRLARHAVNPKVRLIHLTMARRYSERVRAELDERTEPQLQVVVNG
jgi:hypothetical protein